MSKKDPKKPKTGIIIQARMDSSRLPGKVMKLLAGKETLWHVVERCRRSKLADMTIVATSTDPSDDPIYEFCRQNNMEVFRGELENVLARYYKCAKRYGLGVIVRVTADCPLVEPKIIDESIGFFLSGQGKGLMFASNSLNRIFPRGLDCEVFSFSALKQAFLKAKLDEEKKHVTPYIINHCPGLAYTVAPAYRADFRLTLDEEDDYKLLCVIYDKFYEEGRIIDSKKVIEFLKNNPKIAEINAFVEQKKVAALAHISSAN